MSETNEQQTEERRCTIAGHVVVAVWSDNRAWYVVDVRNPWRGEDDGVFWAPACISWPGVSGGDAASAARMVSALERAIEVATELDAEFPTGSEYTPD